MPRPTDAEHTDRATARVNSYTSFECAGFFYSHEFALTPVLFSQSNCAEKVYMSYASNGASSTRFSSLLVPHNHAHNHNAFPCRLHAVAQFGMRRRRCVRRRIINYATQQINQALLALQTAPTPTLTRTCAFESAKDLI